MLYTEGEWFCLEGQWGGDEIRGGPHHYPIAKVCSYWQGPGPREKEATANGNLISAAPDLLEALQLHVAYEATPTDRGGSQGPKGKAWKAFVEARDKAIAKAMGQ